MSSRYVFTYNVNTDIDVDKIEERIIALKQELKTLQSILDNQTGCIQYMESSTEEDKEDYNDGDLLIDFTGNGYLKFWKRCKMWCWNNTRNLTGEGIITDLYTGEEKQIAW